ncbi:MFS transporter, partial [Streptomyces albiflaviniger]|nr:MFS transporter [Streptomyces albiflaviniger]
VMRMPTGSVVAIGVFGFLMQLTIPAMYAYVSELYPTTLRASGFGWASSFSRVLTGFAPMLFGSVMWPLLGLPLTFGVLAVAVLGAVVWTAFAAPETKGRDLDEDDPTAVSAQASPEPAVGQPVR